MFTRVFNGSNKIKFISTGHDIFKVVRYAITKKNPELLFVHIRFCYRTAAAAAGNHILDRDLFKQTDVTMNLLNSQGAIDIEAVRHPNPTRMQSIPLTPEEN